MGKTPRQQLAAWLREQVAGSDEVLLPDLAKRAVAAHATDSAFLAAWFADTGYAVAYTLATQVCAETRMRVGHDQPSTPETPPAPPAPPRRAWLDQLEHVGDRYVRFGDMTKEDLRSAIAERKAPALTELHRIGLMERLAGKLGAGQRVREQFSEEDVERWSRLLTVRYSVSIPVPEEVATKTAERAA